jgi:hypothetical protein
MGLPLLEGGGSGDTHIRVRSRIVYVPRALCIRLYTPRGLALCVWRPWLAARARRGAAAEVCAGHRNFIEERARSTHL